jgi:hypothetical protein
MHAASSADSLGDRHQGRHLMMPVAAISRVTSDRLCRWLMAGDDGAWPQRPSAALHDPQAARNHRRYDTDPARSSPLPLACRPAGRIDRRSLHRICPPNPHSAR